MVKYRPEEKAFFVELILCAALLIWFIIAVLILQCAQAQVIQGQFSGVAGTPGGALGYYYSCGGGTSEPSWNTTDAVNQSYPRGASISTHPAGTVTEIAVKIASDDTGTDQKTSLFSISGATWTTQASCSELIHPLGTGWVGCTGLSYATSLNESIGVMAAHTGATDTLSALSGVNRYYGVVAYSSFPGSSITASSEDGCIAVRIKIQ